MPFPFQPALSTIVPHAPPSINRTHVHTHTVPFKQANHVRSVLRISPRYSSPPPYLCHRFHLLRGQDRRHSPLFIVPLDQLLPRRLISFHVPTTVHHNVDPRMTDGRKKKKKKSRKKREETFLTAFIRTDKNLLKPINLRIVSRFESSFQISRWRPSLLLTQRNLCKSRRRGVSARLIN